MFKVGDRVRIKNIPEALIPVYRNMIGRDGTDGAEVWLKYYDSGESLIIHDIDEYDISFAECPTWSFHARELELAKNRTLVQKIL